MLLAVFVLIACLLFTSLAAGTAEAGKRVLLCDLRFFFASLIFTVYIVSFVSLILLEQELFETHRALVISAFFVLVFSAGLLLFLRPKLIWCTKPSLATVSLVLIALLATYLRVSPSNYLLGGQDHGAYVNLGNHLRQVGSPFITDNTLQALSGGGQLREYYLASNYKWLKSIVPGQLEGAFSPGILVADLGQSKLVPQFYHLHSLWFAISGELFGPARATYSLVLFGVLSVLAIYFLAVAVFDNQQVALLSAFLLAISPFHTYFSRFPVSEITASLFFLTGLYFYLASSREKPLYLLLSLFGFGCFFYTRVTGFLLVPVMIVFTIFLFFFERNRVKEKSQLIYFSALYVFYALSVLYGLEYSLPYARDVYMKKLHLGEHYREVLSVIGLLVPFLMALLWYTRKRCRTIGHRAWIALARYRRSFSLLVYAVLLLLVGWKGYEFAFTDTFNSNPRLRLRYGISGEGLRSLEHINLVILARFLTLPGILLFFYGGYVTLRKAFSNKDILLFCLFLVPFLFINAVHKPISAYLYYYARYMLSELFPLMVICCAYGFALFIRWLRRPTLKIVAGVAIFAAVTYAPLEASLHNAQFTTLKGFYERMAAFDQSLEKPAMIFIEQTGFPTYQLRKPLRMTFGNETFVFRFADLGQGGLADACKFFSEKGYHVYALAATPALRRLEFLPFKRKFAIPEGKLEFHPGQIKGFYKKKWHQLYFYRFEPVRGQALQLYQVP